jgi:xanthine/uracil permease
VTPYKCNPLITAALACAIFLIVYGVIGAFLLVISSAPLPVMGVFVGVSLIIGLLYYIEGQA